MALEHDTDGEDSDIDSMLVNDPRNLSDSEEYTLDANDMEEIQRIVNNLFNQSSVQITDDALGPYYNNSRLVLLINGYIKQIIKHLRYDAFDIINIEQRILLFVLIADLLSEQQIVFHVKVIDCIIEECRQRNKRMDLFGKITCIVPDFLWLGDEDNAGDIELLNELGITYILNCAAYDVEPIEYPMHFKEHFVFAHDHEKYDLVDNDMDHCLQFIIKCKQNKAKILIHCVAGMNRSATVVIGYLMYVLGMDIFNAVQWTAQRRIWILYNKKFKQQLLKYAAKLETLPAINDHN
eukprot:47109_1